MNATSTSSSLPSPNPLPLTSAQEAQVREIYQRRVRDHCAEKIREFAACATGRTISTSWACRPQKQAMNACMVSYVGQKEQDAAREEWFANIDTRYQQKKEREKRMKEADKFRREWWGVPPAVETETEGGGEQKSDSSSGGGKGS